METVDHDKYNSMLAFKDNYSDAKDHDFFETAEQLYGWTIEDWAWFNRIYTKQ